MKPGRELDVLIAERVMEFKKEIKKIHSPGLYGPSSWEDIIWIKDDKNYFDSPIEF